ncbi:MAG: hypothetical protein E6K60_06230 [Nitrospirae bacterium]|nr:MAG: hypothetical protein E6K60_06230 [Nitrospirota bacterium]
MRTHSRSEWASSTFKIWLYTCLASSALFSPLVSAEESKTPLAGEAFQTEVKGREIDVPTRSRRSITAVDFGVLVNPKGPRTQEVLPYGSFFVWRNADTRRFRGTFSGLYNDARYNVGSDRAHGWEAVFTFNNYIVPFGRYEDVEGRAIEDVELKWSSIFAGLGIGYRKPLPPGHQDSALEMALTYEPGYLWFDRSSHTSSAFIIPSDTYEGRVHFRLRTDLLDRNLMELAHKGMSFGGDLVSGHRAHWQQWGGVVFDPPDVQKERNYLAGSVYAVAAGGVPFVGSDRHRLIGSAYGGIGQHLDRFSAFRLPGRPKGYEWDALSRPMLPGVAFNELFPRRYFITDLTYRYGAMLALFPYIRGTYAVVERARFADNGTIKMQMDSLPAIGGGIITRGPWRTQIEANYTYNFGIFRSTDSGPQMGGHGIFISLSRGLSSSKSKSESSKTPPASDEAPMNIIK